MKGIIFVSLPYNTDHNYIRAIADGGCKIYIPVEKGYDLVKAKDDFQEFFNNQFNLPDPPKELA